MRNILKIEINFESILNDITKKINKVFFQKVKHKNEENKKEIIKKRLIFSSKISTFEQSYSKFLNTHFLLKNEEENCIESEEKESSNCWPLLGSILNRLLRR